MKKKITKAELEIKNYQNLLHKNILRRFYERHSKYDWSKPYRLWIYKPRPKKLAYITDDNNVILYKLWTGRWEAYSETKWEEKVRNLFNDSSFMKPYKAKTIKDVQIVTNKVKNIVYVKSLTPDELFLEMI